MEIEFYLGSASSLSCTR